MKNLKGFAESPRPLGPDFLTWPPPGSKLPVNWNTLARFNMAVSILEANPPYQGRPWRRQGGQDCHEHQIK